MPSLSAPPWMHFMGLPLFRWQRRDLIWLTLAAVVCGLGATGAQWLGWVTPARGVLIAGLGVLAVGVHCMGAVFRGDGAFRALLLWVILGSGWAVVVWGCFSLAGMGSF